jgi:hypothetical protein
LDSFRIPASLRIKGVQAGETRFSRTEVSESGSRKIVAGFRSEGKEDELCLPSDPNWWKSIPLLTLQMDQGAVGTAGAACLAAALLLAIIFHHFLFLSIWLLESPK